MIGACQFCGEMPQLDSRGQTLRSIRVDHQIECEIEWLQQMITETLQEMVYRIGQGSEVSAGRQGRILARYGRRLLIRIGKEVQSTEIEDNINLSAFD